MKTIREWADFEDDLEVSGLDLRVKASISFDVQCDDDRSKKWSEPSIEWGYIKIRAESEDFDLPDAIIDSHKDDGAGHAMINTWRHMIANAMIEKISLAEKWKSEELDPRDKGEW
jgi:hypothetical protein